MKHKSIFLLIACLLVAALFGTDTVKADTVDDVWSVIDGIAMFKMSESGASDVQEWADGALCEGAGADADAYAYALYKLGKADVTAYKEALRDYLGKNTVRSATTRLKYALCLCLDGQADVSEGGGVTPADEEYISQAVEDSVGKLGVMSLAYGLHLAGNDHEGAEYPVGRILDELMNLRHEDGGWSVMGQYSDVDVTAMVLQSLAVIKDSLLRGIDLSVQTDSVAEAEKYVRELQIVKDGIETGLSFLSGKQNETGDYAGFGSDNAESTAQVLIALSSLDIDGAKDPRFVKNGHSVIDGILRYRRSDGSFSHIPDGDSNPTATSQVFTAMASYVCYTEGGIFYLVNRTSLKREVAIKADERQAELKSGDDLESLASKQSNSLSPEQEDDSTDTDSQNSSGVGSDSAIKDNTGAALPEDNGVNPKKESENQAVHEKESVDVSEEGTDAAVQAGETKDIKSTSPIKGILYISIIAAAVLASALLLIFKKRNPKNFIFVLIVAGLAATVVFFSDFKTEADYYRSETVEGEVAGEVTLSIRCDTIAGLGDSEFVPEDGCILETTTYAFAQDETVYDILVRAVKENKLHMEKKKTGSGTRDYYICGIANIYEYDWGELSGWMYYVNGESPSVGCGEYRVKDGDRIEWLYTREIGRDLKGSFDMLTGEK